MKAIYFRIILSPLVFICAIMHIGILSFPIPIIPIAILISLFRVITRPIKWLFIKGGYKSTSEYMPLMVFCYHNEFLNDLLMVLYPIWSLFAIPYNYIIDKEFNFVKFK